MVNSFSSLLPWSIAAMVAIAFQSSQAVTFTVGNSSGWTTSVDYKAWSANKTFLVGDVLEFNFVNLTHTVAVVNSTSYDKCVTSDVMEKYTTPPVTYVLDTVGPIYFVCTVGEHCNMNQKLAITVYEHADSSASNVVMKFWLLLLSFTSVVMFNSWVL